MEVTGENVKHKPEHELVLVDYLDGSAQTQVVTDAVYLIDHCQECQGLYKQWRRIDAALKDKNDFIRLLLQEKKERKLWLRQTPWVFAMGLLLIVASLGLYLRYSRLLEGQKEELGREREKVTALAGRLDQQARQILELKDRLERAQQPYLNSFSYILRVCGQRSAEHERKAGGPLPAEGPLPVELPQEAEILNLILSFEDEQGHPNYRVSIHASNGRLIWAGDGLKQDKYGRLQIAIPIDFLLKNPELNLRIYGLKGNKEKLIAEEGIKVRRT